MYQKGLRFFHFRDPGADPAHGPSQTQSCRFAGAFHEHSTQRSQARSQAASPPTLPASSPILPARGWLPYLEPKAAALGLDSTRDFAGVVHRKGTSTWSPGGRAEEHGAERFKEPGWQQPQLQAGSAG